MSEKTNNTNYGLIERTHGLESQVNNQAETIGSLKNMISVLENKSKEDQKKVIIEDRSRGSLGYRSDVEVYEPRGFIPRSNKGITKVNMDEASELIAKHINKENESKVIDLEKAISSKKRSIESHDQTIKNLRAEHTRALVNNNSMCAEEVFQAKRSYEESNTKLKHQLQDLKDELKKVKEDKTDELVEKKRNEELTKLKARIKSLEREVKRLSTQGWLGKVWDRISNRNARVEAEKQVEDEKANIGSYSPIQASLRGLLGW